MNERTTFLILFRGIHQDFRVAELYAVVARVRCCSEEEAKEDLRLRPALSELGDGSQLREDVAGVVLHGHVLCYADLRSMREAEQVGRQCLLIRAILKAVAHARGYSACVSKSLSPESLALCEDMMSKDANRSFKVVVTCFGRSYSVDEQLTVMERFSPLFNLFPGKIRMKSPDEEFWIVEDAFPNEGHRTDTTPAESQQVVLARKVVEGAASMGHVFHLRGRKVLGPTSTNAELAFVMANMAHVRPNSVVLDPFCGSGSILVSSVERGAVAIGSDLDYKILSGGPSGRAMDPNFDQYGLPRPVGILRADMFRSPFQCRRPWVDAIVCDPPYGLREGARGFRDDGGLPKSKCYISGTERVRFVDIIGGLLDFAAKLLVPGGRLVFWLPTTPDYCDDDLPRHKDLLLVANCNQVLTMRMHRRLITMRRLTAEEEKVRNIGMEGSRDRGSLDREVDHGTPAEDVHVPAHADFSAKIIRDGRRSEAYLKPSRFPALERT